MWVPLDSASISFSWDLTVSSAHIYNNCSHVCTEYIGQVPHSFFGTQAEITSVVLKHEGTLGPPTPGHLVQQTGVIPES